MQNPVVFEMEVETQSCSICFLHDSLLGLEKKMRIPCQQVNVAALSGAFTVF